MIKKVHDVVKIYEVRLDWIADMAYVVFRSNIDNRIKEAMFPLTKVVKNIGSRQVIDLEGIQEYLEKGGTNMKVEDKHEIKKTLLNLKN